MRPVFTLCAVAAVGLVGCTGAQQVSSTPPTYNPPTVSYSVTTSDLTDANLKAANYCQRYGATARLVSAVGGQATYQCIGGMPGVTTVPPAAVPPAVVTVPPAAVVTPVPTAPTTVSVPVVGSNMSSANLQAANYCRQFGRNARLQSVTGGTAYYNCL